MFSFIVEQHRIIVLQQMFAMARIRNKYVLWSASLLNNTLMSIFNITKEIYSLYLYRHLNNEFGSCAGASVAMSIGYVNILAVNQAPNLLWHFLQHGNI